MIDLVLSRGNVYVWNAEDWLKLRQEHRIIGSLMGCLPKLPRQDVLNGFPLLLIPEEVTLLIKNKIARLIECPKMKQEPSAELIKKFKEYRERMFQEQNQCLKNERIKMIELQMDKIIEGKRRKLYGLNCSKKKMKKALDPETTEALKKIEVDRDELFAQEVAKIADLEESEQIIQTHTAYPWAEKDDIKEVEWKYPTTEEETVRFKVFEDLWNRGFYVTTAVKFGGDFLGYAGDPVMFHALFIVICQEKNEEMNMIDLASRCRVALSVKKTLAFAYLSEDGEKVVYQSVFWESSTYNPFAT